MGGTKRTALPPLWGKEVEVVSVHPYPRWRLRGHAPPPTTFRAEMVVDGKEYSIQFFAKDELEVMLKIAKLQQKKPRSVFHEEQTNGSNDPRA